MQEAQKQKQREKKGKKKGSSHPFEFCKVCNLNHSQGRGHIYFPSHTRALSAFLSRFRSKLSEVLFFLKNPLPLRPEHASLNRLWCVFCDTLIQEIQSSFACANSIKHLASEEHSNSVRDFLRKYGGGMDRIDSFCVTEANFIKWEARCRLLDGALSSNEGYSGAFSGSPKDIQNELCSVYTDTLETNIHSFSSCVSNSVLPLQFQTNERNQVFYPDGNKVTNIGPASYASAPHLVGINRIAEPHRMQEFTKCLKTSLESHPTLNQDSGEGSIACSSSNGGTCTVPRRGEGIVQGFQNFTQIPHLDTKNSTANVHTGGPPPWLETNEESDIFLSSDKEPYLSRLDSHSHQSGKLHKLNPKRVGAAWAEKRKIELEREKRGEIVANGCGDDWLPNFGRVWQAGTRKESRKEFEMEKQKLSKADRMSDSSIKIQPYISKRMVSLGLPHQASTEAGNPKLTGTVKIKSNCTAIISNINLNQPKID